MAIQLPLGFKIGSTEPIDSRLFLTKALMLSINDNIMPDKYFTICLETGEIYLYNKYTEVISEITGKFKALGVSLGEAEDGQILMYKDELWLPVDLTDELSIIYISDTGLSIKGYDNAQLGQMLVKDTTVGLTWINPLSPATLNEAVAAATAKATEAANAAVQAGNAASDASVSAEIAERINSQTMNWVNQKFWWGSLSDYNKLETITEGTFYFILV